MITFPQRARTDKDGTLSLAIPTGLPDSEVEVVVVVTPASQSLAADAWPEGYFTETFGSLRDVGLERPLQGELPERLVLDPVRD